MAYRKIDTQKGVKARGRLGLAALVARSEEAVVRLFER